MLGHLLNLRSLIWELFWWEWVNPHEMAVSMGYSHCDSNNLPLELVKEWSDLGMKRILWSPTSNLPLTFEPLWYMVPIPTWLAAESPLHLSLLWPGTRELPLPVLNPHLCLTLSWGFRQKRPLIFPCAGPSVFDSSHQLAPLLSPLQVESTDPPFHPVLLRLSVVSAHPANRPSRVSASPLAWRNPGVCCSGGPSKSPVLGQYFSLCSPDSH